MTRAVTISPLYIVKRNLVLMISALSSVHFETETDTALVQQKTEHYFTLFGNAIFRLAYSYLHNKEDSEDVLQETLLQYIKTTPKFENDTHAKAWLLRVASNISKNRIHSNTRRETDELSEELVAEEREDLSFVWEAVKSLNPTEREVIHLFYEEGYKTAEIATLLNRKESTIRSDLKRGREALKTILKEAYDFE